MNTMHVPWGSIELLHNVVIALTNLNKLDQTVRYRAKVKLHGKNTAVQINSDGLVVQSRTNILTTVHDLDGFAKWVAANETAFKALPVSSFSANGLDLELKREWQSPRFHSKSSASSVCRLVVVTMHTSFMTLSR